MADSLLPVASFVRTVWTMVTNEEETLIAWSPDGERIVIADPPRFAAEVCPRYFRHNKWTSFARLLNMYEFHKCPINPVDGSNRVEFRHAHFRRGAEGELHRIERKKWTPKSEAKTPPQKRARAEAKANKPAPESEVPGRAPLPGPPPLPGLAEPDVVAWKSRCAELELQVDMLRKENERLNAELAARDASAWCAPTFVRPAAAAAGDDGDGVPELDSATFMQMMTTPFSCFTPRAGAESPVTEMDFESASV